VERLRDNLAVHGLNRPSISNWALEGEGQVRPAFDWAISEGLVGQPGPQQPMVAGGLIEAALGSGCSSVFGSLHLHRLDQGGLPLARRGLAAGLAP